MSAIKGVRDVRTRFQEYRVRARRIIALVDDPRGTKISEHDLAELVGLATGELTVTRHLLSAIGVIRVEDTHPKTWFVLKRGQDLDRALDVEMERQMRGGMSPESQIRDARRARRSPVNRRTAEQVAVESDRLGFPVRAVSGPDAPNPMLGLRLIEKREREPEALVLAAKQYVAARAGGDSKVKRARALIEELKEIGVEPPQELVAAATVPTDDRLETIALVLPYITALEQKVVSLSDQLRDQPQVADLVQRIEKQRNQINRLVAERTQAALQERGQR